MPAPSRGSPPKSAARKTNGHHAPTPDELLLAKLKSSGLGASHIKQLKLQALTGTQTKALSHTFEPLMAVKIPYFDSRGKVTEFYRLRYLEEPLNFTTLTGKAQRYTQPPNSGMSAYLPPSFKWHELAGDTSVPILITEGELKAAKGCDAGFAVIGLGGVFNWKSAKSFVRFLPELEELKLRGREVYIVFDSDAKLNPHIGVATQQLSKELVRHGAMPRITALPDVYDDGRKTGLDDFLVARSVEALEDVLSTSDPASLADELWGFNSEVVYIRNPGLVIIQADGQRVAPGSFKEHVFANRTIVESQLSAKGNASTKITSLPDAWLRWPHRYELLGLTYAPGQPQVWQDQWNLWDGWGCEPRAGDIEPWTQLLDHLFLGAEPWARNWFERWLAFPLQHPGTKLFTSTLMYGLHHGTGKSLVGYVMGKIYGKNFAEIGEGDLTNSFNEWAQHKQFVLGDDVTSHDKRGQSDLLKKMITQKTLRINAKFMPSYEIPDCLNYYFTANQPDAFFLEDHDRRAFINQVLAGPLPEEFYAEFMLWLDQGAGHVFHHLLNLPLDDFNPSAPAPRTHAKEQMIATGKSELAAWCNMLRHEPDSVLRIGAKVIDHEIMQASQLVMLYDPDGRKQVTSQGMGRELLKAGLFQVNKGQLVRDRKGGVGRYYVVRNHTKWLSATAAQASDQLDKQSGVTVPKYVAPKQAAKEIKLKSSEQKVVKEVLKKVNVPLRRPAYE